MGVKDYNMERVWLFILFKYNNSPVTKRVKEWVLNALIKRYELRCYRLSQLLKTNQSQHTLHFVRQNITSRPHH